MINKRIMLKNIPAHNYKDVQLLAGTDDCHKVSAQLQPVTLTVDIRQYKEILAITNKLIMLNNV